MNEQNSTQREPSYLEPIVQNLKSTLPWVRAFVILGMGSVGLIFASLVMVLSNNQADVSISALVTYGVVVLIYIFVTTHLWRFAAGIETALAKPCLETLEHALARQLNFWRYTGIAVFSLFGFSILGSIGLVVHAIALGG